MEHIDILRFIDQTIRRDYHFDQEELTKFNLADVQEMFGLLMLRVESRELELKNLVNTLEEKVKERTVELEIKNRQLSRVNVELHESLEKVKLLTGMLPICANCKKVRDDQGYWLQVEEYITDHSEAQFSHGICPDCLKELYPEFYQSRFGDSQED
ncbi:MAG: hypothetical protein H8E46_06330 [FCB group bacterium]|nr:hypothetical protein [FCB group bacterium]